MSFCGRLACLHSFFSPYPGPNISDRSHVVFESRTHLGGGDDGMMWSGKKGKG